MERPNPVINTENTADGQAGLSRRVQFTVAEDITILLELTACMHGRPFRRDSEVWALITANLAGRLIGVTRDTVKERILTMIGGHKEGPRCEGCPSPSPTAEECEKKDHLLDKVVAEYDKENEKEEESSATAIVSTGETTAATPTEAANSPDQLTASQCGTAMETEEQVTVSSDDRSRAVCPNCNGRTAPDEIQTAEEPSAKRRPEPRDTEESQPGPTSDESQPTDSSAQPQEQPGNFTVGKSEVGEKPELADDVTEDAEGKPCNDEPDATDGKADRDAIRDLLWDHLFKLQEINAKELEMRREELKIRREELELRRQELDFKREQLEDRQRIMDTITHNRIMRR